MDKSMNLPYASVDSSSPYYNPDIDIFKVEVYFNGEKVIYCTEAHALKGYIIQPKRDKSGSFMIVNGQVQKQIRYGNVCIFYPDEE
jgi:hypothetical protein